MVYLSIALAAHSIAAQDRSEILLGQPPFRVMSAFWPNLHNVLWAEAWARRPMGDENPAGRLPEPLTGSLTEDERRSWDGAVAYYDAEVADLHLLFEMRPIRKAMIAAGADLPANGLEPALQQALLAAAPVYRKHWWPAHDAANRAWAAENMPKVAALTPAVPDRLATLYGTPWLTGTVRLDVVRVGAREGAYTSIDPAPAHITMTSSAPALRDWMAAEVLFHEASHAMAFPLIDAFAAELRTQRKSARDLWHVALFYLTGETVRQELSTRGISYQPYLYETGLLDRAWPHYRNAIERHWRPYVHGSMPRDLAIRDVVRALSGMPMRPGDYVLDIVVRWGVFDLTAIFILAVSSAVPVRRASTRWSAIAVAAVTILLVIAVELFTRLPLNVLAHALAACGAALAARWVAMKVATWSGPARIPVALVGAAFGYAAGRMVAIIPLMVL